jgi:hypothetical protein
MTMAIDDNGYYCIIFIATIMATRHICKYGIAMVSEFPKKEF